MQRRMWNTRCVGAAVALFAGLLGCGPGSIGEPSGDRAQGRIIDASPGDRVEVGAASVLAPEIGEGVYAEVILDDGSTQTLRVETWLDGQVAWMVDVVVDEGGEPEPSSSAEAAGESSASGSPGPCQDSAKSQMGHHWSGTYHWSFRRSTTPSDVSADAAELRLRAAALNITRSDNSCGLADQVSARHAYDGVTGRGAQITSAGGCENGDGFNTVTFGDLPDNYLGIACIWYGGGGEALEADIRLNKADRRWVANIGSGCTGRFSIEATATHEFGHVFGLGHVSESAHGNLTMSTAINGPCQSSEATLGRGDVLALRAKY